MLPAKKLTLALFFILFIVASVNKFSLVCKHTLLQDELPVLTRINNTTLCPNTKAYELDLQHVIPAKEFLIRMSSNGTNPALITDLIHYGKVFPSYSNHPPLNEFLGKIFLYKKALSISNLRYYALICFAFLLFSLFYFQKVLKLPLIVNCLSIIIYSSFSLANYQAIFPKAYSLASAFLFLSLAFYLKSFNREGYKSKMFTSFIFLHLTMLSHYFFGVINLSLLAVTFLFKGLLKNTRSAINDKTNSLKIKCHLVFISICTISLLSYYPLLKSQVEGTNKFFDGHLGLMEIMIAFKNIFEQINLNYHYPFGLLTFIIIAGLFISAKRSFKKQNLYLLLLFLVPFFIYVLMDWSFDKKTVMALRYQLVSLPFLAILISNIFYKKKLFLLLFILPMLWINLEYPEVQKYHAVEFSPTRYIDYVEKFDLSILDEPTLFIMPRMTVDDITMMQYLFAKITDSHPFKELNQKTLVQNKRFNNIYFVYHKAKRNNIEDDIERYKIKRFISMLEFAQ